MDPSLKHKMERIIGRITEVTILDEQGCGSFFLTFNKKSRTIDQ